MSFKVYRFTFTTEITSQLYEFNRIHQYSDKTTYKEAWDQWREENNPLIDKEIERLKELGYDGDVVGKLYHTCRYYIRNQFIKEQPEKQTVRKTRTTLPKLLLREMDKHIEQHTTEKPIDAFRHFQRSQGDLYQDNTIRKAYMNRYCVLKQKNKTLE